ncbi:MAG: A/G-specific adenine glycosylase [Bacteroidota bacterium]
MNHRPMPWKGEKNPYKIWLSEIILQQTRVEQGWAYYEKFIKTYPTIQHLARAKENEVFKLWEGLGYYNRCRNLLFTAKHIVNELHGVFPNTYEGLIALKGVGPYTAAAIASFAYNLPYAVVDGNVFRVFSRFYGIHTPIDTKLGLEQFNKIANENLATKKSGIYNQALMDFGATVCKPMAPLCAECIMRPSCNAYQLNKVGQLPIKEKVIHRKNRYFDFFCFIMGNKVLLQKREMGDIWAGLFQFYLVENDKFIKADNQFYDQILTSQLMIDKQLVNLQGPQKVYTQMLTHQQLTVRFHIVELKEMAKVFEKGNWTTIKSLKKLAFPKTINSFLAEQNYFQL